MRNTYPAGYDKKYEFFDKKSYEEMLHKLYSLTDTRSPKTLAVYLDEPEAKVQEAIQHWLLPTEWLLKVFFNFYEMIQFLSAESAIIKEGKFNDRYTEFKKSISKESLDSCMDSISYALLHDDALLNDPDFAEKCEKIIAEFNEIKEERNIVH